MQIINLPYHQDSAVLFEKIIHLPGAIFLDSCYPHEKQGRYDILAAQPDITLTTHNQQTLIETSEKKILSNDNPFEVVKQYLKSAQSQGLCAPKLDNSPLPFTGGAIGYFSYYLGRLFEKLPSLSKRDIIAPEMVVGIYDWVIIVDHLLKKTSLVSEHHYPSTVHKITQLQQILFLEQKKSHSAIEISTPFQSNFTYEEYLSAFNKAIKHIQQGDCYQINLAQRFETAVSRGTGWGTYKTMRQSQPAPYAAYINHSEIEVLCLSPERFINNKDGLLESKPIKGTRPRHSDPLIDATYAADLISSDKDCTENIMIVDLIRNDLGKNCEIGSIQVSKLLSLESFSNVHHLVSTINGRLLKDNHSLDVLMGCFPGGSVTGAPKIRAMEIIEMLEPHRRSVYCGSIGYIDWNGNMDTNIAIRTLLYTPSNKKLYCYAGGGIVADSVGEQEYQETLTKISKLIKNSL